MLKNCDIIPSMENEWQDRLIEYMERTNLTQRQFSSALGVNTATLNRWIMGRNVPSRLWQKHLRKVMNINIDG